MSHVRYTTTWNDGDPHEKINALRPNQDVADLAVEHVEVVLGDGSSGVTSAGIGSPLTQTVHWTKDGKSYSTTAEAWGDAADLAEAVAALERAITQAGGTVTP